MAQRNGTGMFAREVMNRFPLLPLEEAGWLNDMPLRENSIERIGVYPACTLPQAQVSLTKDLLSLDGDAGEEDCQSFGGVPFSAQADAHGAPSPGQAAPSTTPRWVAPSPTRASTTGTH
jgi:hypothetical protein